MPEIAEVETVRNTLKKRILHKKITNVEILYPKMIKMDIDLFQKSLIDKEFIDIKRNGKYLLFELNDSYLISHLRMEGKYFLKTSNEKHEKHEHVIINFFDNTDLRYHDTRKFGTMTIVKKDEINKCIFLNKLGIEPINENLTGEYLLEKFKNKNMPMKSLLLDQTIINGLGNIYADEVLFAARINPLQKGKDITLEEANKIVVGARNVIEKAILMGGTTIKSYTSSLGVTGRFQQFLQVHRRENKECYQCNSLIERIKVGGRSTYFCPKCQKFRKI